MVELGVITSVFVTGLPGELLRTQCAGPAQPRGAYVMALLEARLQG